MVVTYRIFNMKSFNVKIVGVRTDEYDLFQEELNLLLEKYHYNNVSYESNTTSQELPMAAWDPRVLMIEQIRQYKLLNGCSLRDARDMVAKAEAEFKRQ